jgi:dipeptidase E
MSRLLLLSNSRNPGQGYLEHAHGAIRDFLGPAVRELVFIPFAAVQMAPADYAARVQEGVAPLGLTVRAVTAAPDPARLVRNAEAIAVGGGNTFHLLRQMCRTGLLDLVAERVRAGVPYLGWSAGSNLACPTIRTTNDMPVVEPPSFVALGLVSFQINPHYTEAVLPNHGGETRDERIAEFLALNPEVEVYGLREGSWLRVEGERVLLGGPRTMRRFVAGREPEEIGPGEIR